MECVFHTSVHVKKVTGTLLATCERDRPAEAVSHPVPGRQDGERRYRTSRVEPIPVFAEMTNKSFVCFAVVFDTLKYQQYHSPARSMLCKNIHYLNALQKLSRLLTRHEILRRQ